MTQHKPNDFNAKKMTSDYDGVCQSNIQRQPKQPPPNEKTTKQKKRHPLKMPLRTDPVTNRTICRFHNYDPRSGCKKYNNQKKRDKNDENSYPVCELDHDTCHICLEKGHLAHECKHLDDPCSVIWKQFCCLTLENTRPEDYPSNKTVLGDVIVWIGDSANVTDPPPGTPFTFLLSPPKIPGFKPGEDDLLGRCRRQKRIEAAFMLELQKGAVVVDVGAHLGDTVMTLALHARTENRTDLRFVAMEPCPEKCAFLRSVVLANNLEGMVTVLCVAVGDEPGTVQPASNAKDRARREGSLRYEYCETGEDSRIDTYVTPVITLDSVLEKLSPVGMLHIDVEGWESNVLRGAKKLLTSVPHNGNHTIADDDFPCYVIAEAWTEKECLRRGFSGNAEESIMTVMENELNGSGTKYEFERIEDIVDIERNLVYVRKKKERKI